MERQIRLGRLIALVLMTVAAHASAAPSPRAAGDAPVLIDGNGVLHGGAVGLGKATADTIYVLGGPNQLSGKFEAANHLTPDAQGWVGVDSTANRPVRWQASTYNAANLDPGRVDNHAMWCGAMFTACNATDPPEGYGNNYDERLDWRGIVPDNTVTTTVRVTADLNSNSEPGYDFLYLEVQRYTDMTTIWFQTDNHQGAALDQTFTVPVSDYVGSGHNQVHLRLKATSDSGWSDEDCQYPSNGHTQIDNLAIYFNGVLQTRDDFEPGSAVNWALTPPPAVGNFAKVWPRLRDMDPCRENLSPQFAFIDDGVVVPGTGGTLGTTWTYGPGGYTVNLLGGLAGPAYHLNNEVWSPALTWPAIGHDGAVLAFDVYRHVPLTNGLFWKWSVRSSADGGTTWTAWKNRGYYYYSSIADYLRYRDDVTDLLVAGRTHVQVALGAAEPYWGWGYNGGDSTPAPYYDNVSLAAYAFAGPAVTARDIDLFQCSNFAASGAIDYANLAANSVRIDMARNIAPKGDLRNDPGDSMVITVAPGRYGAVLDGPPRLHLRLTANPLFDAVRMLPPGFTRHGVRLDGVVEGDSARATPGGPATANLWSFDLPDTGFFFPGDMFRWYLEARDNLGGDIGTTLLPADTTGFSSTRGTGWQSGGSTELYTLRFDQRFKVRALPTMIQAAPGEQPRVLFWFDAAGRGGEEEWFGSLCNGLGYREGIEFDLFYTNGPSSGVGNGLGGRATAAQLAGYTTLLYTSGDLSSYTLSNGDYNGDPSNDIGVVDAWLNQGGKCLFATGSDLEYDLNKTGTAAVAFRNKWLAVTHNARDVRWLIGTQATPLVKMIPGNAPGLTYSFTAYGGCTPIRNFNAVTATGTGARLAEFTNAAGSGSVYPYAALIYNSLASSNARIIWSPIDFMFWNNAPGQTGRTRTSLLQQVMLYFGNTASGIMVGVPAATELTVRCYPNPFNPAVRVAFTLPPRGELSLKLYDLRGRLVRVLHDGAAAAGPGAVTWDGRDGAGAACASGVYFCEAKGGGRTVMQKLTLVR